MTIYAREQTLINGMQLLIKRHFFTTIIRAFYRRADSDRGELKRILITLKFLLVAILGMLVFTLTGIVFGLYINLAIDLVMIAGFLVAFYLISRFYLKAGKLVIFIVGNLILLLSASTLGPEAGNTFIFYPMFIGIFTLFSYRERRLILLCVAITLTNFIFLEWTDYSFLKTIELSSHYQYLTYLSSFLISAVMVAYFSYYHAKANTQTEDRLKKLNARLQAQNRQLAKTNSELDSFVYKASHDLRAPLTSLLGLIEIVRIENDPEKLKSYSYLQEKLIRRLDTYIQDILTISRNSNQEIRREPIDFEQLVDQSLEQLKYLEHFPGIKKIIHIQSPPSTFYSDPQRITIVLNNLLSNAFRYADFTKGNPYVQLEISFSSTEMVLDLLDNGIGIHQAHINKVFQMFYRATDKTSGSGLGLYIVKEVIEKLAGKIRITSQAGQWTRFEIRIPNARPADEDTPAKAQLPGLKPGIKTMV
jgi:signal transduction histidine kinase